MPKAAYNTMLTKHALFLQHDKLLCNKNCRCNNRALATAQANDSILSNSLTQSVADYLPHRIPLSPLGSSEL